MMPAASNKIEAKPSAEATEPTKQFLNLLDKKVRNIEKRKSKLDVVRAKQAAGEILEKEQKEAITHYDSVLINLDFARELQKNFNSLAADIEKQQKKQAKREKMEKASSEMKRIVEVLQVQTTLDTLGADTVRQHFKTGKHGAVVLTEDNLTSLDELYQLISPSRDGDLKFESVLNTSGEHLVSLLESRERPLGSSTYKELMELVTLINGCGYFERVRKAEAAAAESAKPEEAAEEVEEVEPPTPVVCPAPVETFPDTTESEHQNSVTVQQTVSDLEENSLSHSQVLPSSVSTEAPNSFYAQTTATAAPTPFPPQQTQAPSPPAPSKNRPLPEIISSVRGTFSFLQDSEIELDSPHMDPAVVAAQPMMRASQLAGGFPAPPMVDSPLDGEAADPLSLSQQNLTQSSLDYSQTSQTFAQAGLSHSQNLGGAPGFQSSEGGPQSGGPQGQQGQQHPVQHVMLGQGRGAGEPAGPPFDLPPSIPMPPSQQQQAQDAAQLAGEKKFQLNASATEFQSRTMYPTAPPNMPGMPSQPPPSQPPSQTPGQTPHPTNSQPDPRPMPPPSTVNADFPAPSNFAQAAGDYSQAANNFQGSGFQRGGRGGPNNYRGGPRGGAGVAGAAPPPRGVPAGNGLQNGFNSRPQNNNNTRLNGRGGAPFQGFPPRNDYRPDGYQGYNTNGFGGPAAYQKRGGAGGQGFAQRGNARGAGGMRGGPPRTGPPRGAAGNQNRGGMTRPANQ